MKRLLLILIFTCSLTTYAQYTPGSYHYGLVGVKPFDAVNTIGAGVRVEYAYNCYNTFMAEYNRSFAIGDSSEAEGYNEFAFGSNLILFNWYPTTITAGMGFFTNDDSLFESRKDAAVLFFQTGDLNHGVQIKVRALHHLTKEVHLFGELNLKSLGGDYHTFLVGFNYNFNPRR